jgi:uncharacterized glyoxalase superfamily protein PhnB
MTTRPTPVREDPPVDDGDELEAMRRLRPDVVQPDDPPDPATISQQKERLMSTIDETHIPDPSAWADTPDLYPRLAYEDEHAAVAYLSRVFGFVERREARLEEATQALYWLQLGTGVVMVTHANTDVHLIHSPREVGLTTVMLNVYVPDIDAHYAHAVQEGAEITMDIRDAFFGDRLYEATDPEGHRWHFAERFTSIAARGGRPPEDI